MMIHYHGTPVSGGGLDAVRLLRGRHAFISFAAPANLQIAMEVCQTFALDNGAFSLWGKGKDVPVEAYAEWVLSVAGHPGLDWCVIPDKIDGTEDQNRELMEQWLADRWLDDTLIESVPVWHLHESFEYLDELSRRFRTVALGSSGQWSTPGKKDWWGRMSEAMSVVCDSAGRPRCRLHGLRMLNPVVFSHLPLASADSVNAARNGGDTKRFGMYAPPTAGQRCEVIASRVEMHNSAPCWTGGPHV